MELLAVRLARLMAFFPAEELNPHGYRLMDNFMPAFIERYDFRKYPEKADDFDEAKGITFELGRWQEYVISQLVLYNNGILVDTISSTKNAEAMLEDAMMWAAESFKLAYRPAMLNRKAYLSELLFRSDTPLDMLNPKLKGFTERLTKSLSNQHGQSLVYETTGIGFHFDPFATKLTPAMTRIERLTDAPFSENKYYTVAPLQTDEHIQFIIDFEDALKS